MEEHRWFSRNGIMLISLNPIASAATGLIFLLGLVGWVQAEEPTSQSGHLFILSGQSNMTGGLEKGFTEVVEKQLGKDQVTIVRSMRSGRGIRFWVKGYGLPDGHERHGQLKSGNGEEYPKLLKAVQEVGDIQGFQSVTFIWMQGESDANRDLSAAYAKSFKSLTESLKRDLGLKQMNFVIGRISDWGLHDAKKANGWKKMRAVQMQIAESDDAGAWIDTDDLNGGDEKNPAGELHYPGDQYPKLGARFAEKALEQLKK